MPDRPLTDTQRSVLEALRRHQQWPGGWIWENRSQTVKHLDALVKKGYAKIAEPGTPHQRYEPTDKQEP